MTKLISILTVIFFTAIIATSCKKDSASPADPNDLSGTSWVNKGTLNGLNYSETISFKSKTDFTDLVIFTGTTNSTFSVSGTYIYKAPDLTLLANGVTQPGTITGNNLYSTSSTGSQIIYIKQ